MRSLLTLLLLLAGAMSGVARDGSRMNHHDDGTATLMVDGAPYIIIGGETGNSMASCPEDVETVMQDAVAHGYNTVLIPVAWELIEPQQGKFDFTSVDTILDSARRHGLKVVPLWFGAWKNSMSCYAPAWFKRDTARYPRAMTRGGKPLEIASAFSPEVYEADAKAFRALLHHLAKADTDGTVIMLQIENEIGMLEDARDHSPLAQAEYDKGVPDALMSYLKKHTSTLHPNLLSKWREAGMKESGTWAQVFGDDIYTDELFQAYNYALYVERLAREARKVLPDLPLYVNAAMNSRGRQPGQYPSGGPLAHLKDIWHAAMPSVDLLAPDLYDGDVTAWFGAYALSDNPLFVPEIKATRANAAQAYYVVGEHGAVGLSPFAYNLRPASEIPYQREGNTRLRSLVPLLDGATTYGLYFTPDSITRTITDEGIRIKASHYFTLPWDPRATDGSKWPETGGLILRLSPMEYIVAGSGIVLTFDPAESSESSTPTLGEDGFALTGEGDLSNTKNTKSTPLTPLTPSTAKETPSTAKETKSTPLTPLTPSTAKETKSTPLTPLTLSTAKRTGLASVEEVAVNPDGSLTRIRTFNGDETHQGRHVRIGVDEFKILHVKLYPY